MKKSALYLILMTFIFLSTSLLNAQTINDYNATGAAGIIAFAENETRDRLGPERLSEIAHSWAKDPGFLSLVIRPYGGPPWCLQFVYNSDSGQSFDELIEETQETFGIYAVRTDYVGNYIVHKSTVDSQSIRSSDSFLAGNIEILNGDENFPIAVAKQLSEVPGFFNIIIRGEYIQFAFYGLDDEIYEILDNLDTAPKLKYASDIGSFNDETYIVIQREFVK
ncbi:MAG: hypothetical protein OCD02_11635 [Spirochaetaceae bacterium]